jgi:hypothetical protein
MSETNGKNAHYHAEATVLEGHLKLPLVQQIEPQAHVKLAREGGYFRSARRITGWNRSSPSAPPTPMSRATAATSRARAGTP